MKRRDAPASIMVTNSNQNENRDRRKVPVCRVCLTEGVVNSRVVEKAVGHPRHKSKLLRWVCVTCLDRNRETLATCATFKAD
jgi:hypothetical protein